MLLSTTICPGFSQGGPDETAVLSVTHSVREGKLPSLTSSFWSSMGSKSFFPYRPPLSSPTTASSEQWQASWKSFKFLMDKTKKISQIKVWFGGNNNAGNSWALLHGLLKRFVMLHCLSQCFWRISNLLDLFSVLHKVLPLLCLSIAELSTYYL